MNTELLLAIADQIEREPRTFDLRWWEMHHYRSQSFHTDAHQQPLCGTTRCISGWASFLADGIVHYDARQATWGREALDLTKEQAQRLFYVESGSIWHQLAPIFGWHFSPDVEDEDEGWEQIEGHQAAKVLRSIACGELTL